MAGLLTSARDATASIVTASIPCSVTRESTASSTTLVTRSSRGRPGPRFSAWICRPTMTTRLEGAHRLRHTRSGPCDSGNPTGEPCRRCRPFLNGPTGSPGCGGRASYKRTRRSPCSSMTLYTRSRSCHPLSALPSSSTSLLGHLHVPETRQRLPNQIGQGKLPLSGERLRVLLHHGPVPHQGPRVGNGQGGPAQVDIGPAHAADLRRPQDHQGEKERAV